MYCDNTQTLINNNNNFYINIEYIKNGKYIEVYLQNDYTN